MIRKPRLTSRRRVLIGLGLLLCGSFLAFSAAPGAAEQLDYRVTYRGIFSFDADLPIADLSLTTRKGDRSAPDVADLNVSSGAYPFVESLYPIRYRFRSWTEPADHGLLGFETSERTRDHRHRLYLRDASISGVKRYNLLDGEGRTQLAQLAAGQRPALVASATTLFDRLGLLQRVRAAHLYAGAELQLPVTSGRARLHYQVRVEGAETVRIVDRLLPAWKVRFEGFEPSSEGRRVPAHRPVFAWLAKDAAHTPLLIDARNPIGRFRIELAAGGKPPLRAQDAAKAAQSSVRLR